MEEQEFRQLLDMFPVVRSRNYCADSEQSKGSTSQSAQSEISDWQSACNKMDHNEHAKGSTDSDDPFWQKLKLAAGRKVSPADAERFCKAFQLVHKRLVNEELSLEAAQKFIGGADSSKR